MKIVHVVRQFSPSVGGLEEAVRQLGRALQSKGVAVSVVTLNRVLRSGHDVLPAVEEVDGLHVERIPFQGSGRYPIAPGALSHVKDADLVHVHAIDFFFDFFAATRLLHRKPLVASTHGGFFHTAFAQRLKRVYFNTVTRASCHAYDAICASSEADYALFQAIAPRRLTLAANGVDVEKWRGIGSAASVPSLIYIGRFSSNKNVQALFPLLKHLRMLRADWSLTIAGRPWDVSVDDLRREAEQQGVATAVRFLTAPTDAEIAAAIGGSSYIVSASAHEGFGISIVEGLSAGLVPVLSDIPPFRKLIDAAKVGLIGDFGNPAVAAAAVDALHEAALGKPGDFRSTALRHASRYGWDSAAETFLRCYDDVLVRRGRKATSANLARPNAGSFQ